MDSEHTTQAPYQGLAPVYDYVMRHVDYDEWVAYVQSLFERWDYSATRIVDLACGTGNISFELHRLNYEVTGVDLSDDMLRVAEAKGGNTGIEFVQRDLCQLAGLGPFDAAVCMYDSFNYLLETEDLDEALTSVETIVRPEGLFIFDICTEHNSLRYFRDMRDREEGPGFAYERHSTYDAETRLQRNHFVIHFDTQDEVLEETHIQRIYPVSTVIERVEASSFELLDLYDGFTFNRGTEISDRIHFVLRAPKAE